MNVTTTRKSVNHYLYSSPRLSQRPLEWLFLKSKVIAVVLLTCFLSPLLHADQEGEFEYSQDGSAVTITGFIGKRAAVTVPEKIANLPVTTIGRQAFRDHKELISVTLPSGVTTIESYAFVNCSLTNILLPQRLKVLGENVFIDCNLTNIIIPSKVTNIGKFCFGSNKNLTNAIFHGNAPTIGNKPFIDASPNFCIRYIKGATGFTRPHWGGCNNTVEIDPANEIFDWSIKDGKVIKAKFVKLDWEAVVIRTEDGKEKSMPFTSLSPDSCALAKALSKVK
jgi:BspA type Leucine rich repeat region (6 copies)